MHSRRGHGKQGPRTSEHTTTGQPSFSTASRLATMVRYAATLIAFVGCLGQANGAHHPGMGPVCNPACALGQCPQRCSQLRHHFRVCVPLAWPSRFRTQLTLVLSGSPMQRDQPDPWSNLVWRLPLSVRVLRNRLPGQNRSCFHVHHHAKRWIHRRFSHVRPCFNRGVSFTATVVMCA